MMKSSIKFFILAIMCSLIVLPSCNDKLDLKPYNELETEIALQTPNDVENLLKGAYRDLLEGGYYGGWFLIVPDLISDNLIICQNGRQSKGGLWRLQHNSTNTWNPLYQSASEAILNANTVLANVDLIQDEANRKNITAEALTLRALAYFDIARVFGKMPQNAGTSDLATPYLNEPDVYALPSRLTVAETYANIIADLEAAKDGMNTNNGLGRLNIYAVHGLLSRVYLYAGDYQKARDNAKFVVDNSSFQVTPRGSFGDLWDNVYDNSTVFRLVVDDTDDISLGTNYSQTGNGETRSEYVPDFNFYFQYASNDIRRNEYFETGIFSGDIYNHIKKYMDRPGSNLNVVDAPVLRMEEVYLNLAEAESRLNNDGAAIAALDALRSERYSGFTSAGETGTTLLDAIKFERRLELAFEGHRMFDLKRWNEGLNRSNNGEFADGTGTPPPANQMNMAAGDTRWEFPIDQREMNINPNMVQNPGY